MSGLTEAHEYYRVIAARFELPMQFWRICCSCW